MANRFLDQTEKFSARMANRFLENSASSLAPMENLFWANLVTFWRLLMQKLFWANSMKSAAQMETQFLDRAARF